MIEAAKVATTITPGAVGIWSLVGLVAAGLIKLWPVMKKLSMDETDKLIALLQADGLNLRERLRAVEQEYADYRRKQEVENEALRVELRSLKDEIHGLRNQLTLQQSERITHMAGKPSDDVLQAAVRSAEHVVKRSGA